MLNNYHNGAFNKGNPAPTRNQHTVPSKLRRIFRSFGQKINWVLTNHTRRKRFSIFIAIFLFSIFIFYTSMNTGQYRRILSFEDSNMSQLMFSVPKYLINTSTCRIPDIDPYNKDVVGYFKRLEYVPCSKHALLTYIEKKNNVISLRINESLYPLYSSLPITCCYSIVHRISLENRTENKITVSKCKPFVKKVKVTDLVITVSCTTSLYVEVYANVHLVLSMDNQTLDQKRRAKKSSSFSVMFVGIDSISKLNLVRTMPNTYAYLEKNDFINLKGYTKISDNTFPNLMGILSGETWEQVYEKCHPARTKFNKCDMIWNDFKNGSYVTAYGEDEPSLGTFNYNRLGFLESPTDFYSRPYFLAAVQQLAVLKVDGLEHCAGPETSGERILNFAKDFAESFVDIPNFSFFWMNSFSHENLNGASRMDDKIAEFLRDIQPYLNNTIFVFLSDHGFRFGNIRYTHTGWLEERMPFFYVLLPNSFKKLYSQQYKNFLINSYRLTTPFDVYMMLQDILFYSNSSYKIQNSIACPKCQSLFKEIDENRTCEDAAIAQHWCTCTGHTYIDPRNRLVQNVAKFVLSKINHLINNTVCAKYKLNNVVSSGISELYLNQKNQSLHYLLLIFKTAPYAVFEATVEVHLPLTNPVYILAGDISRINSYGDSSNCVMDSILQKYCYCYGLLESLKNAVNDVFRFF